MKLFSALHIAALHGQAHLVDLLIQHGAVVNASDYLGYTPLHLACQKGYQNIVVSELWKILFCKKTELIVTKMLFFLLIDILY